MYNFARFPHFLLAILHTTSIKPAKRGAEGSSWLVKYKIEVEPI